MDNYLNPEEEFIFRWQYRILGDFSTALMHAIERADDINMMKLEIGFPVEVEGYRLYTQKSGWWQNVQRKAATLGYFDVLELEE